MKVPTFTMYFPSVKLMDGEQKAFYKYVEQSLNEGIFIDVNGNISYVFVYLYELLKKWNHKGFETLSEHLINLSEAYRHEKKLSDYCLYWAHDCLLGLKKYKEYLEKTEPKNLTIRNTHLANLRLNIQYKLGLPANPIDLLIIYGNRRSSFITENQAIYKDTLTECFEEYSKSNSSWFNLLHSYLKNQNEYEHTLFNGSPLENKPKLEWKLKSFYSTNFELAKIIEKLSRDAENKARELLGVPRIGEGWISETKLYRKLEKEFPETIVIQHGRPFWLGRQHFDIWFPNWKIAVEYHGQQHFEPVDFFGGEVAFKKTVERDLRKKNLARRHGVKLFIITEKDCHEELIKNIRHWLSKRQTIIKSN